MVPVEKEKHLQHNIYVPFEQLKASRWEHTIILTQKQYKKP